MVRPPPSFIGTVRNLPDQAATETLASEIAPTLARGDVIALSGDLGVGKTVFARALIRMLGAASGTVIDEVPSPTYTLVQLYDLPGLTVYHFDLYRLAAADEAWEIGIEEAFAEGLSIIEWAERIEDLLPTGTIRIHLDFASGDEARTARIDRAGAGT